MMRQQSKNTKRAKLITVALTVIINRALSAPDKTIDLG